MVPCVYVLDKTADVSVTLVVLHSLTRTDKVLDFASFSNKIFLEYSSTFWSPLLKLLEPPQNFSSEACFKCQSFLLRQVVLSKFRPPPLWP